MRISLEINYEKKINKKKKITKEMELEVFSSWENGYDAII